jgi:hypothetical protein
MTKDEALDLALEALNTTESDCGSRAWDREQEAITAIKQARALDKMAENARELGLDYEPVDGTQVSKVWWDGEKLMAKPIPLEDFYQPTPVQEPVAFQVIRGELCYKSQDDDQSYGMWCPVTPHTDLPFVDGTEFYTTPPKQPAPVQEPAAEMEADGVMRFKPTNRKYQVGDKLYLHPAPAAPVQESVAWMPIETAPQDGTKILGWNEKFGARETQMTFYGEGSPGFAAWKSGKGPKESGWNWSEPKSNWSHTWKPTHWMPMPAAPVLEAAHGIRENT